MTCAYCIVQRDSLFNAVKTFKTIQLLDRKKLSLDRNLRNRKRNTNLPHEQISFIKTFFGKFFLKLCVAFMIFLYSLQRKLKHR